jgi:hypothetical protein
MATHLLDSREFASEGRWLGSQAINCRGQKAKAPGPECINLCFGGLFDDAGRFIEVGCSWVAGASFLQPGPRDGPCERERGSKNEKRRR